MKSKFIQFINVFKMQFTNADVSNSAVIIAYYTLLSIFPAIIFIGNLLPMLHLKVSVILEYLKIVMPSTIYNILAPLIESFLKNGSGGLLSIGAVVTLWTASKGINALKKSFNHAYGVATKQNAIISRVASLVLTISLVAALGAIVLFFGFGQMVVEFLTPIFHLPNTFLTVITTVKWPVALIGIFIIILLLYRILPSVKLRIKSVLPGTILTTIGWILLAQGFSIYVRYFGGSFSSYGAIGTVMIMLFWLNFGAWIIMLGAVLNATIAIIRHGEIEEQSSRLNTLVNQYTDRSNRKK
ncbi:YihY/virulence factor BrkB family protein [Dellaglioa sp. BT-FLS60]